MNFFKRLNQLGLVHAICVSMLVSACGKKQDAADVRSEPDQYSLQPQNGELSKTLFEMQSGPWAEECDRRYSKEASELVYLFDQRSKEIAEFTKRLPPEKNVKTIPFGDQTLTEYFNLPEAKKGWHTDNASWRSTYADYQAIRNQPMNRNWIIVNNAVRSLLSDDRKRVLGGVNPDLRHDSGDLIFRLLNKVTTCQNNSNCDFLALTADEEEGVLTFGMYKWYVNSIRASNSSGEKRDLIERFVKRLKFDSYYYEFDKNYSVTTWHDPVSNKDLLKLPIDGTVFTEAQREQLRGYIEPVWRSDSMEVKIEWREEWANTIFKMFFEAASPGRRAYVQSSKREIHFFPLTDTKAIAHEIGHVLGLADLYYTQFNSENCVYKIEYSEEEIMSSHYTGKVSASDWAELKKNYVDSFY